MNLLGHFAAACPMPELRIGSVLGDTLKNRDFPALDPVVLAGARFHRACDVFTDSHPAVARARKRLRPGLRRVSGILLDVYFDHLITRNWSRLMPEPLDPLLNAFYTSLEEYDRPLPPKARSLARWLVRCRPLGGFRSLDMVEETLKDVNRRLCDGVFHLADDLPELTRHDAELEKDLLEFFPSLQEFCEQGKQTHRWAIGETSE